MEIVSEDGDAGDDIEGEPVPAHDTRPAALGDDEAPESGDDGEVGPHPGLHQEEGGEGDLSAVMGVGAEMTAGRDRGDTHGYRHDDHTLFENLLLRNTGCSEEFGNLGPHHHTKHEAGEHPAQGHRPLPLRVQDWRPQEDEDVH